MSDNDTKNIEHIVPSEILSLIQLAEEAEELLCCFRDPNVSGALQRCRIEECKLKLIILRDEIVSLGEVEHKGADLALYIENVDRYDVLRRQQQGMEDELFRATEGPGRMSPLKPLIYGNRPGYRGLSCNLGRYSLTGEFRATPLLANVSASPVPEIQDSCGDLSSGLLDRTLPMLDIEIGVINNEVPGYLLPCTCGRPTGGVVEEKKPAVRNSGNIINKSRQRAKKRKSEEIVK